MLYITVSRTVPVAARLVVADHAILLRAQRLDRALRGEVEIVGTQAHHPAFERIERVLQEQELARGVDVALLPVLGRTTCSRSRRDARAW